MKSLFREKKNNKELVTIIFSSLCILFSLTAKWEIIPEIGLSSSFADCVSRLAHAFFFSTFSDLFIFLGIIVLIKQIKKVNDCDDRKTLIVSGLLALTYIISISFMKYSSMQLINNDLFQFFYSLLLWLGATFLIFYLIRYGSYIVSTYRIIEEPSEQKKSTFFANHTFLVSFILIVLGWLFWLLCTFPGICNVDAIAQLIQYFSGDLSKWTTHHPPFSTFVMGSMVRLGQIVFKSADIGYFMYLFMQTIVGASIIAYGIVTLKETFKIKDSLLLLIVLFFAVVPFWGVYAALFEKSLFYSEFALLVTILILPVVKDRAISNKRMVALCLAGIFASLLRNNGIYAVVPTLIALIFYLKDKNKKRLISTLILVLLVFYGVNNILYSNLGIKKGSVAEALSVPFQQTAKYVRYYSDEITEDERAAIDAVLDYDSIGELYDYNISNPIKDTYKGDNSKLGGYLKVWFTMFFKHPGIYFSAFIDGSYGYIAPVNQSVEATTDFDYASTGLQMFGLTQQAHVKGVQISNAIRTLSLTMPIIKYLSMPGLYTWIMVLSLIAIIKRKRYEAVIMFIPAIINVLVCLASPLSTSMRYSQPTVAAVPFLSALAIYYIQSNVEEHP